MDKIECHKKDKKIYTKDMIVNMILEDCNYSKKCVNTIYDSLCNNITKILSYANDKNDIQIRIFNGFSIDSTFIDEEEHFNRLTGENILTKKKIRIKPNVTRHYMKKVSDIGMCNK